jgi:hypothetical protein
MNKLNIFRWGIFPTFPILRAKNLSDQPRSGTYEDSVMNTIASAIYDIDREFH